MLIRRKTKTRMTKIAAQCSRHCTVLVLRNFSPLFPFFLSSCNVNPLLLLGLCLCLYNPFFLLIVVYYYLLPGFICSVVGPVSTVCDGSWICCSCCCYLILPTFICLCSPYFFHITRGSGGKNVIFQIASGPILSIPIHSNTCQYDPCKVLLKKMTLSFPMNLPKSAFFGISDWASD